MCDMNVKERLKEAFESVAFSADNTWIDSDNTYQKTNLELYSAEKRLQQIKVYKLRPRTVEDCIPSSRLAKYTNPTYYDESREMCYVPCNSKPSHVPFSFLPNEPWEMFEVDELFYWYMAKILPLTVPVYDDAKVKFKEMIETKLNRNFPTPEECYESPFLNAAGFEDKILKTQLTEDRIKSIWSHSITKLKKRKNNNKIFINIYFSPIKNYYVVKNDVQFDYNWYWKVSSARDLAQIEKLSKALKKQSTRAENWLRESSENAISSSSCTYGLNEPSNSSTEVLYSEVLQGLASSRKSSSSSSKHDQSRIIVPDDASSSSKTELSEDNSNNFTNFTVLNPQKSADNKYQQQKQNSPIRIFQNKMKMYPTPVASSSTISCDSSIKDKSVSFSPKQAHYFQTEIYSSGFKANKPSSDQGKFLMDAGPASFGSKAGVMVPSAGAAPATAHANYFQQQAYFYPPTPVPPHQGQQRWIPSSFCYPPQMYNSPTGWMGQNQVIMSLNYDFNRFVGQSTVPLNPAAPALKTDLADCSSHVFNITTLNKQANGSTFSGNLTATSCSSSVHLKTYPTASVQQQIPTPEVDGYPFTANTAEELEIQALEQYNSSNENFYKELERQASEQYAPE